MNSILSSNLQIQHISQLVTYEAFIVLCSGLIIGSFLNVVIYRIPRQIFWKQQRSACPECHKTIPFYHNIPVLSWILLKGRASCCGFSIPKSYLAVEIITPLIFVLVWWFKSKSAFGLVPAQITANEAYELVHFLILSSALIAASFIDLEHMIIPDSLSLGLVLFGLGSSFFHPYLSFESSIWGVLIGGGILYAIAWIYWLVRKKAGIGMGDAKLLAGIGACLGSPAILPTILVASVTASLAGIIYLLWKRASGVQTSAQKMSGQPLALPFGPFLSLSAIVYLLFGNLTRWF